VADERTDPASTVTSALRQALGDPALDVRGARPLAGGAMHEWWSAATSASDAPDVVIRLAPAARDDAAKARMEFEILSKMRARGVRVARPIYVGENPNDQTFMVSERVEGDTNPRQLLMSDDYGAARHQLVQDLAADLAIVHTVMPSEIDAPLRSPEAGEDALVSEVARQLAEYDRVKINPHPLVEWSLRWIARRVAKLPKRHDPPHVVHGDLRIGNILYNRTGLAAILDWEGVHAGEAEEDLSWFCTKVWRFNRRDLAAGGITDRETWVQAYERAGGRPVDRERLRLWEILQNVRWAVICMMQAKQHLDGWMDSHEHAAIGRRAADTELEVLRLAGVAE
jgi:aminoglycoside phosphotransferase (APT) family kinase protein